MEVVTEQRNMEECPEYIPKTIKGLVERSYLQHREAEEDNLPNGEIQLADVSVAVWRDRESNVILDLVSVTPDAIETVEEAIYNQHTLRKNLIELPAEEMERIARSEAVEVLSLLLKLEKSRIAEKERLLNYEQQLDEYEEHASEYE